ncbi:hypothetical protein BDFB_004737 [Asbolus verrucosus]|uniref:Uncharacterized protein n=1 Tax=Asbolus verrucosus TaxID=1661398 RepID=A0A482VET5_ASBVE|nr:hypothetical protein BDFB_004737 [Asbolus verrucosus]
MKGQGNQVSNGPKEQLGAGEGASGSEEFEPWRSQQQNSAAHTAYPSVPISSATDLYNMSTAGRLIIKENAAPVVALVHDPLNNFQLDFKHKVHA